MSRTTQANYFLCTFFAHNMGILEFSMLWKPRMNIHKSHIATLSRFQQDKDRHKYWLK